MSIRKILEEARKPSEIMISKEAKEFAEKNRAGLMSAFAKALRMQKTTHALYYGALLMLGGHSKWYVGRRVLIAGCEDGTDPNIMQYVADMHLKSEKEKSIRDVLRAAVGNCIGVTWWNEKYGRDRVRTWFMEKGREKPTTTSKKALLDSIESLVYEGTLEAVVNAHLLVYRLRDKELDEFGWSYEYLQWIADVCKKKGVETKDDGVVQAAEAAGRVFTPQARIKDGNWEWVLRYIGTMGSWEGNMSYDEFKSKILEHDDVIEKIVEIAMEHLKEPDKIVIPSWAYDGMHASNKKLYSWADRRFPGSKQGFYNCLLMYKKNDRLDPRDQAELDSCKVPEDGLRLYNEWLEEV